MEAELEAVEVEDGVDDELAWAVVGDVSAAVGFLDFDAVGEEVSARGEEVRRCFRAARDGDDRRVVLDEEHAADMIEIGCGGFALGEDLFKVFNLKCVGVGVTHALEVDHVEIGGHERV